MGEELLECSGRVFPVDPLQAHSLGLIARLILEMIHSPIRRSKAAGLRLSRELSSFNGVRHFWQYMLAVSHSVIKHDKLSQHFSFEIDAVK